MSNHLQPNRMRFRWARIDPDLPGGIHKPQRDGDCGWDLSAMSDIVIPPLGVVDVPVNARLELPDGFWGEIKARSSIAKRGLQVDAGTIDNGYRGPLYVILRNVKSPVSDGVGAAVMAGQTNNVTIQQGERIGQLVFHRLHEVWDEEVAEISTTGSDRGESAFGSTGR